jgi:hypothetical protein
MAEISKDCVLKVDNYNPQILLEMIHSSISPYSYITRMCINSNLFAQFHDDSDFFLEVEYIIPGYPETEILFFNINKERYIQLDRKHKLNIIKDGE